MTDFASSFPPPPPLPPLPYSPQPEPKPEHPRPTPAGRLLMIFAWVIVVLVSVLLPIMTELGARTPVPSQATKAIQPVEKPDMQITLASRIALAQHSVMPGQAGALMTDLDKAAKTPAAKVGVAVIAAELVDTSDAIGRLETIEGPAGADAQVFRKHFLSPESSNDAALESLRDRYGWFVDVAKAHGQPADSPARKVVEADHTKFLVTFGGAGIVIVLGGLAGLALLIVGIIFYATGRLRLRTAAPRAQAGIYVEAFAIYLLLMIGISVISQLTLSDAALWVRALPLGLATVAALAWPLIRQVPLPVFRFDLGLHKGEGVFKEMAMGIAGYLAGLPLLAIGFGISLALTQVAANRPTHPITEQGIGAAALGLYFLASVFAPITEELMFRGLLVTHLRRWMGPILSGLISGIVFAAIHPQGWTFIPALTAIGLALAIVRQWRDTLIPSMTAHALHNGMVVTLLVLITS